MFGRVDVAPWARDVPVVEADGDDVDVGKGGEKSAGSDKGLPYFGLDPGLGRAVQEVSTDMMPADEHV